MNDLYSIKIFIILTIIIIFINYKYDNCFNKLKNKKYILLWCNIIIHSIISNFLLFGWMFNNKIILKFYILRV